MPRKLWKSIALLVALYYRSMCKATVTETETFSPNGT